MKNYSIYIITILVCLFFWEFFKPKPITTHNTQPNNTHILQDFALAHCMAISFNNKEVHDDANATANTYINTLKPNNNNIHYKISELAKNWTNKTYPTKSGEEAKIMKCIDFYLSKELQQTIENHTKEWRIYRLSYDV